ncbi:MAG: DUF1844 domain-containing protein [Bryobacterales bacterium]|nr:DUF1844 domain-containing protein [Bryobacteraceae bacterium]MDW8131435.1 DUF1844 domain-containing protein [Bryobacterales bacterium]
MDEERTEQAAAGATEATGSDDTAGRDLPLPPPTFEFLTLSLRMQAEAHLGLISWDEGQPRKPDFRRARHTIDLMAMLEEKTRGNLTSEERRLLENSLTELRFRYVQMLEESRKKS